MNKKDPAFLLYSKDWLEGTSEMTSEEKGIYIDLLASQHQKGSLPTDTKRLCKLARCGEEEFLKIWPDVSHKFVLNGEGRLVNRKLTEVITERLEKGKKNKVISALAVAVRQSKEPYEIKYEAKKGFKVDDFIDLKEPFITERVTEWFSLRLKSIVNGNANEDANEDIYNNSIVSNMLKVFKKLNPKYPEDKNKDFTACFQIAVKVAKSKGWEQHEILNGKQKSVLESWETIVNFIVSDNWFCTRSLFDINNEWQRLIQSMNNKKNGNKNINGQPHSSKQSGNYAALEELRNEFKSNTE